MVGVWEPSTLAGGDEAEAPAEDALPEGDDYFSVRGELIYTRPETGDLVVKVRVMPRPDGSRPVPFKLQLKGEVPLEHLRHFVALNLRRQGQVLQLESFEVIGPVAQRGNRGGKGRRDGGSAKKGGKGGKARPTTASQGGGHAGGQRNTAVSRPAP
jgi:hypothetical protein